MAAASEKPGLRDRLKGWALKGTTLAAIGGAALTLGACSSPSAAEHVPTSPPTASGSQLPGSSETQPITSSTETVKISTSAETPPTSSSETSKSPEVHGTVLTNSEIFNSMTPADQALVEKDTKLSFEDFEQLDAPERARAAAVLADAHSADYIEISGEFKLPDNRGQKLKDIYQPATGKHFNVAKDNYKWAKTRTPDTITTSDNDGPYIYNQLQRAIAFSMAATGDKGLLEEAEKIISGLIEETGSQADYAHGDLAATLEDLKKVSADKSDPSAMDRYPQATTGSHYMSAKKNTLVVGFTVWDNEAGGYVPGKNNQGMTACAYYPVKVGGDNETWQQGQCTDGTNMGFVLEPNK